MAFKIKKGKRIPNENDNEDVENTDTTDTGVTDEGSSDDGSSEDGGSDETEQTNNVYPEIHVVPPGFPLPPSILKSNVVATQSWVYRTLKGFWNWTKFFATQTLQVAGRMYAKKIKTLELQGDDIYAKRLVLLDPKGKPAIVWIDENGDLQREYKYEDVYLYLQDGVEVKSYVYRFPEIITNFYGLTPIETYINFIPYQSNDTKELNGNTCPRLCEADEADEIIKETLLLRCNETQRIVGLKVLDSDGELLKRLDFTPPDGVNVRRITVNMPCFKPAEGQEGETSYVVLPGEIMDGNSQFRPFVPPFLKPPMPPPQFCPPTPPVVPPVVKPIVVPPNLSPDLFDDKHIDELEDASWLFSDGNSGFNNIGTEQEGEEETPNQPFYIQPGYQVAYEPYHANTYSNVIVKRSDFDKNKEQYLALDLENV